MLGSSEFSVALFSLLRMQRLLLEEAAYILTSERAMFMLVKTGGVSSFPPEGTFYGLTCLEGGHALMLQGTELQTNFKMTGV